MFLEYLQSTGFAVIQILIISGIGYFLVKKNILGAEALDALSRLTIDITLPLLIFCQLIERFNFTLYPDWWIFPLLSIFITLIGWIVGKVFSGFIVGAPPKMQFVSLITFQNSGYLPLALLAALLPSDKLDVMFVCLFLFLAGFNLIMFSVGPLMLTQGKTKAFDAKTLLSPPVVAVLVSLLVIFFGLASAIPELIFKPLKMIGDCTLPLAMLVVGGGLAQIRLAHVDKKVMGLTIFVKLFILPAIGLFVAFALRVPESMAFLIVLQCAMPSAATLPALARNYKQQDLLLSQGIFLTHLASIITIPLFLSIYFMFAMVK
ncbi:MAG: AEC family transporter [Candidatus Omnitrophica bacterium]|nr:AEC family transporter [Candidatus Omnitrophota bacterium]